MAQVSSTPPQQRQRPQLMRQKLLLSPEQHSVEKKMTDAPVSPADTLPSLTDTTRSSSCGGGSPTNLSPPTTPIKDTINNTKTNNEAHVTFSLRSEATIGSLRSGGSGSTATTATAVRAARLSGNLMRSQHRDPFEIYKTVSVLGEGSMGSVCKVKKRSSAVGGSARPEFVRKANSESGSRGGIPCCLPILDFVHSFLPKRDCDLIVDDPTASYTFADSARSELTTSSGESSPGGALGQHKHSSSMISYNSNGSGRRREHIYALKSILLDKCANTQLQKELLHEVAILRETDHAHIARAIETFDYQNRLFICLELCSGGDLYARDPYTERQAAGIVADVLSAIAYLHSKGIIHRDLKFENIMFVDKRPDAEVKLIDFGLSQKFASQDEHMSDAVGTVYTMAPELLAGQYNAKADVWSIGVIAYMLLSSSMPFFGKTRYAVMKQICKGKVKFSSKRWKKISKYGKGFVLHLLESDPHERPSADRALRYAKRWIEQLDAQIDEANLLQQSTDSSTSVPTSPSQRQVHWSPSRSFNSSDEMEMMDRIQASIHAFSQYNTLKKLALMVIAYKSTASEIGWIRSTFNQFDLLQNGEISLEEFTQALSDVYDYSEEELESLFVGMDVDGTGVVHYTEFLAATIEAHGAIDEDRIADAFDRIDCDDSGYITIQNLRDFLGEDVPESYLEAIIDDADKLRDKRISYDEFLQLWDPTCDATLRHAKADVADRRARRSESLISLSGNGTESDDEYFDDYDYPTTKDQEPTMTPVPDRESKVEDQSTPLSFDKTPVMSNMGAHEYGAVEFFSQRKAMSVRAWA